MTWEPGQDLTPIWWWGECSRCGMKCPFSRAGGRGGPQGGRSLCPGEMAEVGRPQACTHTGHPVSLVRPTHSPRDEPPIPQTENSIAPPPPADESSASEWLSILGPFGFCRRLLERRIRGLALCLLEASGRAAEAALRWAWLSASGGRLAPASGIGVSGRGPWSKSSPKWGRHRGARGSGHPEAGVPAPRDSALWTEVKVLA